MGRTALHVACRLANIELVTILLTSPSVKIEAAMKGTNNTPLHVSSYAGETAICELLLKHGANVNCTNSV